MATKTLRAKYKNGVLTPLAKVDLPDDTEVTIQVDMPDELSYEERLRRFLASAGSWAGEYDWDKFLEDTYRDRSINTRPEVKL